jgi:hypothetical protein
MVPRVPAHAAEMVPRVPAHAAEMIPGECRSYAGAGLDE